MLKDRLLLLNKPDECRDAGEGKGNEADCF